MLREHDSRLVFVDDGNVRVAIPPQFRLTFPVESALYSPIVPVRLDALSGSIKITPPRGRNLQTGYHDLPKCCLASSIARATRAVAEPTSLPCGILETASR